MLLYNQFLNIIIILLFIYPYHRVKKEGLNKQEITEILQYKNKLKDLCHELEYYYNRISELKYRKLAFEQEIHYLQQRRIDNYDGINPI